MTTCHRFAKWAPVLALFCSLTMYAAANAQEKQDEKSVRRFVQGFYSWYVPRNENPKVDAYRLTLKTKADMFAPELLLALREDAAAQAKVKDEIVGLDFDPFLNSQDPAPRYVVGKIGRKGSFWFADVHSVISGRRSIQPDVVAQVHRAGRNWRFVNFLYSKDGDLLRVLRQLKRDRRPPPTQTFSRAA